jgi:hypothetical protein
MNDITWKQLFDIMKYILKGLVKCFNFKLIFKYILFGVFLSIVLFLPIWTGVLLCLIFKNMFTCVLIGILVIINVTFWTGIVYDLIYEGFNKIK